MKRTLLLILALALSLSLFSCGPDEIVADLSTAKTVEIAAHAMDGSRDVKHYQITNAVVVSTVANTFARFVLERVEITEPTKISYEIRFLDVEGRELDAYTVLAGHNVIERDGVQYQLRDDMNLDGYLDDLVKLLAPILSQS